MAFLLFEQKNLHQRIMWVPQICCCKMKQILSARRGRRPELHYVMHINLTLFVPNPPNWQSNQAPEFSCRSLWRISAAPALHCILLFQPQHPHCWLRGLFTLHSLFASYLLSSPVRKQSFQTWAVWLKCHTCRTHALCTVSGCHLYWESAGSSISARTGIRRTRTVSQRSIYR